MPDGSVGRDRVEKWRVYRKIPSSKHYVLVERDKALVDRSGDAWFVERVIASFDAVLELETPGLSMPLAEIYANVLTAG